MQCGRCNSANAPKDRGGKRKGDREAVFECWVGKENIPGLEKNTSKFMQITK